MNAQDALSDFSMRSIKELMKQPPNAQVEGLVKSWLLYKSPDALISVYDLHGGPPLHMHHSQHIGVILEGSGYWLHKDTAYEVGPMDYINSQAMVPHNLYVKPGGRLLAMQVTTPAEGFDEAIWLKPGDEYYEVLEDLRKKHGLVGFNDEVREQLMHGYYPKAGEQH